MSVEVNVVRLSAANEQLKLAFLKWQCRLRQIAVRDNDGRPSDGMMPSVLPSGSEQPMGHVITVLNRESRPLGDHGATAHGAQHARCRQAP